MMRKLLALAAVFAALVAPQAVQAQSKKYNLTLCAASVGGTWSLIGTGIDAAMRQAYPGSIVTIQTSAGGIANAASLQSGGCDMAIMHAPEMALALKGEAPFSQPMANLRLIARIEAWSPLHLMVTKSFADKYNLKTVADLAAAKAPLRVVIPKTGNIASKLSSDVLTEADASPENLKSWGGNILYGAVVEQGNLIRDRRADAGMGTYFPGTAQVQEVSSSIPLTLLSIPDDMLDKISERWNAPEFTIKAGDYDFLDHDVKTVTLGAHLVTLESMPDDAVQAVLTAIIDHADKISSVHPSMKRLNPDNYAKASLPYHQAAVKFYRERGMMASD